MKLLTADQIRAWDAFTIQNEPISSYALMERASTVFTDWFLSLYDTQRPILIFCGTGNNGGDGLVIARFLSFEIPKLAFLLPENQAFVVDFAFKRIGLLPLFLDNVNAQNIFVTADFIRPLLKKRNKFDHKGTYGHALLVVGSAGMAGAAVLAARACMRSGIGLLTVHTPQLNRLILQISLPEAIVSADDNDSEITQIIDFQKYTAVGIGCGIGKEAKTADVLRGYLTQSKRPLVLDADALNIISEHPGWLNLIPENSILTPHPKEFERLFGKADNDFDRLDLLRTKAQSLKINILLKGAHTVVADSAGVCYFNSTGNAGMATAGSGDVLTGIITGFLAQGYEPKMAAILGVYRHGLAGDWAAAEIGQEAMLASDIIENMGLDNR